MTLSLDYKNTLSRTIRDCSSIEVERLIGELGLSESTGGCFQNITGNEKEQ